MSSIHSTQCKQVSTLSSRLSGVLSTPWRNPVILLTCFLSFETNMAFVSLLGRICLQNMELLWWNKEAKHQAYTWYTASTFQCTSASMTWHVHCHLPYPTSPVLASMALMHFSIWRKWHSRKCSRGRASPGSNGFTKLVVEVLARGSQKRKRRSVSHTYTSHKQTSRCKKLLEAWEILQDSGLFCMHFFDWFPCIFSGVCCGEGLLEAWE